MNSHDNSEEWIVIGRIISSINHALDISKRRVEDGKPPMLSPVRRAMLEGVEEWCLTRRLILESKE